MSGLTAPAYEPPPQENSEPNSINVGNISVEGDVEAPIIIGNNNKYYQFSSNTKHGVVVNIEAPPTIKRRITNPTPPRKPREFIGRESQLKKLEQYIDQSEAILVAGHEGIGKTTLVKKAAQGTAASKFPDGVLYIDGLGDQSLLKYQDILQYMFDAFYESNPRIKVTTPEAQVYLGKISPLVILDNVELQINFRNKLPDLLSKGALIATSRNASPDDTFLTIQLSSLARDDAIHFLIEKSGVTPDPSYLSLADRICDLLADTPLAIAKIANLIREGRLTLDSTVSGLESVHPPSQNAIQAAIERSFGLIYTVLNKEEREMLITVAISPGLSVDRPWLESTAKGKLVAEELEDLELLQSNSPRLRLHDGFKELLNYGRGNLYKDYESILKHFIREAPIRSLDFEYISKELGTILGLIQWAVDQKLWSDVIVLGKAVDPYLTINGLWEAWEIVLNHVLEASINSSDQASQAWALHQLGSRAIGTDNIFTAVKPLVNALRIRESLKDEKGAAFTRHNLFLVLPPNNKEDQNDPDPPDPNNPGLEERIFEWYRQLRAWLYNTRIEYPIWFYSGSLILSIIGILILLFIIDFPQRQLEISIRAEKLLYLNPANDAIQYTYSINSNKNFTTSEPFTIVSELTDSIDCQKIELIGNQDNILQTDETLTCTSIYKITPQDTDKGSITNRARILSEDKILSGWSTNTIKLEPSTPSIELSINSDTTTYDHSEQEITYTYTITNSGNTILNLPVEINDDKFTVTCDSISSTGNKEILFPSDQSVCFAKYRVTQTDINRGSLTNTAEAIVNGIRSNKETNTIEAKVVQSLMLSTTISTPLYDHPGQIITYTFTVENSGNVTLDQLPVVTSNLPLTPCTLINPDNSEDLLPKAKATCTATYTITQDDLDNGQLRNNSRAKIGNLSSNESSTLIVAEIKTNIKLSKTATPTTFNQLGQSITYTYVISNNGNATLQGEFSIIDDRLNNGSPYLCGSGALAPNGTLTCSATYTITTADLASRSVTNNAIAVMKEFLTPTPFTTPTHTPITAPHIDEIRSKPVSVTVICPAPPGGWTPYVIQSGITLSEIGRWSDNSAIELMKSNCLSSNTIYAGQTIFVPAPLPPATISGIVYADTEDQNQSGSNEVLPNITMTLIDLNTNLVVATTTTGEDGRYTFSGLDPGNYQIFQSQIFNLYPGESRQNINFIIVPAY